MFFHKLYVMSCMYKSVATLRVQPLLQVLLFIIVLPLNSSIEFTDVSGQATFVLVWHVL